MDKKTKLLLGVGVVGVGAYLLFKGKKSTPSLTKTDVATTTEPAKFVGANSFASVGERMISADSTKFASVGARQIAADGGFASVGSRQIAMSGGMINSTEVVGARAGSQASGIFANQSGGMINSTEVVGARVGSQASGIFANQSGGMINSTEVVGARVGSQGSGIFANQPFTGDVANMVGANGFVNQTGKFFTPRTVRYGQNEGVFAPKRKSSVETMTPMPVTQSMPQNNLVGADGGFFSVQDGFLK
jgi:hypothetical protein